MKRNFDRSNPLIDLTLATLPVGSAWRRTKIATSSDASNDQEAVRYWYEVQRLFWSGKLGNLILLPMEQEGASAVAMSDYDQKAAFYRDSGAAALFPVFSGNVANEGGRYSRSKFSFDECQQRQVDLVERLASIYLQD